mmetsp:Transcript_57212/g.135921  ORF Transcript_57212/g.135921 Transcript_57212/m.135921 type:complete len:426 (+) Transcript_57212:1263-2540(+)
MPPVAGRSRRRMDMARKLLLVRHLCRRLYHVYDDHLHRVPDPEQDGDCRHHRPRRRRPQSTGLGDKQSRDPRKAPPIFRPGAITAEPLRSRGLDDDGRQRDPSRQHVPGAAGNRRASSPWNDHRDDLQRSRRSAPLYDAGGDYPVRVCCHRQLALRRPLDRVRVTRGDIDNNVRHAHWNPSPRVVENDGHADVRVHLYGHLLLPPAELPPRHHRRGVHDSPEREREHAGGDAVRHGPHLCSHRLLQTMALQLAGPSGAWRRNRKVGGAVFGRICRSCEDGDVRGQYSCWDLRDALPPVRLHRRAGDQTLCAAERWHGGRGRDRAADSKPDGQGRLAPTDGKPGAQVSRGSPEAKGNGRVLLQIQIQNPGAVPRIVSSGCSLGQCPIPDVESHFTAHTIAAARRAATSANAGTGVGEGAGCPGSGP